MVSYPLDWFVENITYIVDPCIVQAFLVWYMVIRALGLLQYPSILCQQIMTLLLRQQLLSHGKVPLLWANLPASIKLSKCIVPLKFLLCGSIILKILQ